MYDRQDSLIIVAVVGRSLPGFLALNASRVLLSLQSLSSWGLIRKSKQIELKLKISFNLTLILDIKIGGGRGFNCGHHTPVHRDV